MNHIHHDHTTNRTKPHHTTPHDHGELGWMMMIMMLQWRHDASGGASGGHKVTWLIAGKLLKTLEIVPRTSSVAAPAGAPSKSARKDASTNR